MPILHPVPASNWVNISDHHKALLKSVGAVPVNDVFEPVWYSKAKIKLLRGGRGGGKSEISVDALLNHCLEDKYFKSYYGRKIFDTVRGSCFATLVAAIKKNGLEKYFSYSEANTSSMIITCKNNGNTFIPFGADKAHKLKSIKDPTHIWCEEFDQFTFEDFKELYPTLRTLRGRNEFWGTFNAYAVYESHWILQLFYPNEYSGDEKIDTSLLDGIDICDVLANFTDNYFIDQVAYERMLRLASAGNEMIYEGIANGAWGITDNKNPWLYNFEDTKHISDKVPFLPTYPVYISFDFNNDPFACTLWQFSPQFGLPDSFIHCIGEITGKLKIEDTCSKILSMYPNSIFYVTGDRSGQNEDIGRNQTLYQMIAARLGINDKALQLNNTNLEHADSRILLNTMFYHYPSIKIFKECKELIKQCRRAKVDTESKKPSQLLKNREDHKNDEFDSMRYLFQTYFHNFAKDRYLKALHKR